MHLYLRSRINQAKLEKLAQFAPEVFLTPKTRSVFRALAERLTRTTPTLAEEYFKPMHRIWYDTMRKIPAPYDWLGASERAMRHRVFSEVERAPKILREAFGIPFEESMELTHRIDPEIIAERLRQDLLRTFARRYPWLK